MSHFFPSHLCFYAKIISSASDFLLKDFVLHAVCWVSSLANFHTLAFSLILLHSLYVCARVCEHMSPTPLIKCQCSLPALIRVAVKAPSNCMWPAAPLPRSAQGWSISLEHLFEYLTALWMAGTIHQDILEPCFPAYFVLCTPIDFGQIPLKVCYF